jgi:hypothetical protein
MLTPILDHAARTLWRARVYDFWPIWMTMTAGGAVGAARAVAGGTTSAPHMPAGMCAIARGRLRTWPYRAGAALVFLAAFLTCYGGVTLFWEDFTYYDDSMFTLHTLKGQDLDPPIRGSEGRFFPFGNQEFNLVRRFTDTVAGYHVLPIAQLLVMSCLLLMLDDELDISVRAVLAAFALITPGVIVSFSSLIFAERNVMLLLVLLLLSVKRFEQTQSTLWAVAAVVCAQFMAYYKETASLFLVGFACARLIGRSWGSEQRRRDLRRLPDKASRLDVCLASVGVAFLLYYVLILIPHPNVRYADGQRLPLAEVVVGYLKTDPSAWLLVALLGARVYLILRRMVAPSLLWDAGAAGCTVCLAAYLCLRMYSSYYLAPIDLFAALYVGRFAVLLWGGMHSWVKVAAFMVLFGILLQEGLFTAYSVFEEKNVVHGKSLLARAIETQYRSDPGRPMRLLFPFTKPSLVMQFASYLSYGGVPVEGVATEPGKRDNVVVLSAGVHGDGRCVYYEIVMCHPASKPAAGDLVIVLPDDEASMAEVMEYRVNGRLMAGYTPHPEFSKWLKPFMTMLHVGPPNLVRRGTSDRWLEGAVFVSY